MIEISHGVDRRLLRVWPFSAYEKGGTIEYETGVQLVGTGSNRRPYYNYAAVSQKYGIAGVQTDVIGWWMTTVGLQPSPWADGPADIDPVTRRAAYFLELCAREMGFFIRYRLEVTQAYGIAPDLTGLEDRGREVVGVPEKITLERGLAYMLAVTGLQFPVLDVDVLDSGVAAKAEPDWEGLGL